MTRLRTSFILAFGAHPDDVELGAGGTCALHAKDGVTICDLTAAEMSSNGDPLTRFREARAAARELGAVARVWLQLPDRGLRVDPTTVALVTAVIRSVRPRIVLAPHPVDRHPDHGACARLVTEAVFTAGLLRHVDGRPPHRVEALYHYLINGSEETTVAVDVSTVYDRKRAALRAYGSQFLQGEGIQTPLTQDSFLPAIEGRDRLFGQRVGCSFAEGFWRQDPAYLASLHAVLRPS